jgi:hypothetical protein
MKFTPLPMGLRGRVVDENDYARFYGTYVNRQRKKKRFSFQVRMSPILSGKQKYRKIVTVCSNLLNRLIPVHTDGQVFSSFKELLNRTEWQKVRRLLMYEVNVEYPWQK